MLPLAHKHCAVRNKLGTTSSGQAPGPKNSLYGSRWNVDTGELWDTIPIDDNREFYHLSSSGQGIAISTNKTLAKGQGPFTGIKIVFYNGTAAYLRYLSVLPLNAYLISYSNATTMNMHFNNFLL